MSINPNYNNSYWNTVRSYYQPTQVQPSNIFAWVQGDAGAQAYMAPPGTTAMLMDSDKPILYMKSFDASGRPVNLEKRYIVSEEEYKKLQTVENHQNEGSFVTREEFDKFVSDVNSKFVRRKEKSNG